MTLQGQVKNGVVTVLEGALPPEGTLVSIRVKPLKRMPAPPKRAAKKKEKRWTNTEAEKEAWAAELEALRATMPMYPGNFVVEEREKERN